MGSCLCSSSSSQVFQIGSDLDSKSGAEVYIERITHISADITEKIRKRVPKKEQLESWCYIVLF